VTSSIIVWGATGQAKVVREAVSLTGVELAAVFDNDEDAVSPFPDVPIYHGWAGFLEWKRDVDPSAYGAVVAVGGTRGHDRVHLGTQLAAEGFAPWTVIHPHAYVATDAQVGAGSQVMVGATLATQVRLGRWCLVNTAASVDHESVLADGVHIGPGAHLAGAVDVGARAMVGTGATVAPRVRIGADAIVGAGSVVLHDVEPGTVVVGNPARVLRRV
jgi:sugar O-acyltransferase (sialic acid O-acetyltransferase NeuD family)